MVRSILYRTCTQLVMRKIQKKWTESLFQSIPLSKFMPFLYFFLLSYFLLSFKNFYSTMVIFWFFFFPPKSSFVLNFFCTIFNSSRWRVKRSSDTQFWQSNFFFGGRRWWTESIVWSIMESKICVVGCVEREQKWMSIISNVDQINSSVLIVFEKKIDNQYVF